MCSFRVLALLGTHAANQPIHNTSACGLVSSFVHFYHTISMSQLHNENNILPVSKTPICVFFHNLVIIILIYYQLFPSIVLIRVYLMVLLPPASCLS